jgi:hypothetical protein
VQIEGSQRDPVFDNAREPGRHAIECRQQLAQLVQPVEHQLWGGHRGSHHALPLAHWFAGGVKQHGFEP